MPRGLSTQSRRSRSLVSSSAATKITSVDRQKMGASLEETSLQYMYMHLLDARLPVSRGCAQHTVRRRAFCLAQFAVVDVKLESATDIRDDGHSSRCLSRHVPVHVNGPLREGEVQKYR